MNVKELREALSQFPDDMEVIVDYHSDYSDAVCLETVEGVPWIGGGVMRSHKTMSTENKAKAKQYLRITSD